MPEAAHVLITGSSDCGKTTWYAELSIRYKEPVGRAICYFIGACFALKIAEGIMLDSNSKASLESVDHRTPRERLLRLARLFPIKQRKIPRSAIAYGLGITAAIAIVVILAVVLGTSGAELFKSYTRVLWELTF